MLVTLRAKAPVRSQSSASAGAAALFQDVVFSEGGVSLLFVLPTLVYFFIWSSMPSI